MPYYSLKSTAIKLMTWDPEKPKSKSGSISSSPMTRSSLTPKPNLNARCNNQNRVSSSPTPRPNPNTRYNDQYNASKDPAEGFEAIPLSESYFNSEFPGIGFLGSHGSYPFFLVHAGKEILQTGDNGSSGKDTSYRSTAYGINAPKDDEVTKASWDDTNELPSRVDSLPSLSPIASSCLQGTVATGNRETPRIQTRASSAKMTSASLESKLRSRSTRRRLQPIKLVFELPERAYVPSIVTKKPYDLCINIYYNGQLSASRILKAHCHPSERDQQYSGRRLQTEVELPWAIVLSQQSSSFSDDANGPLTKHGQTVADRWDQINKLLAEDSSAWKKHDGCRSPMYEYLEELAKVPIPESLKNAGGGMDSRMGLIDIAITMGHSIPLHSISRTLYAPQHKIFENKIGKNKVLVTVPKKGSEAEMKNVQKEAQLRLKATAKTDAGSKSSQKKAKGEDESEPQYYSKALSTFDPVITNSVLTFPTAGEAWTGLELRKGIPLRKVRKEREAIFRAEDVLVGVRYVLGF
ncbi:hypothetical protein BP5796_10926 [Coleophoma crateriformis]|uniref:Uncharacterized protein n=1 Tax=Coleophoma crateriformis TaxID=565419 RepID=A0A3D8QMD8_9HELO|nr:hypothetical protein BP5796_10926 [Coleophoma crateriformis]